MSAPADAPVREDLLHLTPEALTHAANAGLVKRAMRELTGGDRPELDVDAQGLLQASFRTAPSAAGHAPSRCPMCAAAVARRASAGIG